MNSANETLRAIRHRKALLRKAKDEGVEEIMETYNQDMAELDREERNLLEQFNDVPVEEIYKED